MIVSQAKFGGKPCPFLSEEKPCMEHNCGTVIAGRGGNGWREMRTPGGDVYYYNRFTKKSTTTKPAGYEEELTKSESGHKNTATRYGPCQISAWSAWGACTKTCGTGTIIRHRHVLNKDKKRCAVKGVALMKMQVSRTQQYNT
jgi:hypothetical protein